MVNGLVPNILTGSDRFSAFLVSLAYPVNDYLTYGSIVLFGDCFFVFLNRFEMPSHILELTTSKMH